MFKEEESSTSNPQVIMKELRSFYSDRYKKKSINENSETLTDLFFEGFTSSEIDLGPKG